MKDTVSIVLAIVALGISAVNAWLTLLRAGNVRMTHPTVVYFGPDGGSGRTGESRPKIFLRTLLFSTSQRGRIVESMHVKLRRGESTQTFNVWVHGDKALTRGSGLYAGQSGVACNHHFLLPDDGTTYQFLAGSYQLEVSATLVGERRPCLLSTVGLSVSNIIADQLRTPEAGVYFDWGPDSGAYHAHTEMKPQSPILPFLGALPPNEDVR